MGRVDGQLSRVQSLGFRDRSRVYGADLIVLCLVDGLRCLLLREG